MRISHVITRLIVGGAQENTVASVLGLARRPGFQVDLIAGPTEGREGSLESVLGEGSGVPLTLVPSLVRPVSPFKDFRALIRLAALFRKQQSDVVHTHSGKAGFVGRLAARIAGVPIIVHTIHGPSFGSFQSSTANAAFRTAERIAGAVTDHFVVVAHAMSEMSLGAGIKEPGDYTRILSGFDLDPYIHSRRDDDFRRELGFLPGDFVIGKLARLTELKGHDDLLDAAASLVRRIPSARFLFIGDGAWWGRLRRKAEDLGLAKHVVFRGLIPPGEVPRHLAQLDALVHLSRREGLPRALPQALAAGVPVVAYDCDGAREICLDGRTGFLISPGDLQSLVGKLSELAGNPILRRQMGEHGRALVEELFPVERMVDELAGLYLKLAEQRSESGRKAGHS